MTVCGTGASAGATEPAARAAVGAACASVRDPSVGILFAGAEHDLAEAIAVAREVAPSAGWIGASAAGEMTEAGVGSGLVVAMVIRWDDGAAHAIASATALDDPDALASGLRRGIEPLDARARKEDWPAMITLLLGHGLSDGLEALVVACRRTLGRQHPMVGGGAADDRRFLTTWVSSGDGAVEAGVVALHVAGADRWGVGIGQGAEPVGERMIVTRARGNRVLELDGRPPIERYRAWSAEVGEAFDEGDPSSVGAFLVRNELGIHLFDEVVRIRAGLAVADGGAIDFAGEVPEGSVVSIVRAEPDGLIAAAGAAAARARAEVGGAVAGVLVFSCVTRAMVLGDRAGEELAAIRAAFDADTPILGFHTYGEIARVVGKLDGLHNHAVVVAAIPA